MFKQTPPDQKEVRSFRIGNSTVRRRRSNPETSMVYGPRSFGRCWRRRRAFRRAGQSDRFQVQPGARTAVRPNQAVAPSPTIYL